MNTLEKKMKNNILILSCGSRNTIIHYFKKELKHNGLVIATDCSKYAPALYDADKHYIVPSINNEDYLNIILSICRENNISGVFSLIDPELTLLAENRQRFLDIGSLPLVSDHKTVEMCFNKFEFYNYLIKNDFKTIKTYINKDDFYTDLKDGLIAYPVFVKPVSGSASININIAESTEEVEFLYKRFNDLIIQELMYGKELGIDVYIDMISGEPVSIFAKEKIAMRAGETDKSISIKDDNLFTLIIRLVKKMGLIGMIDIDIFKTGDDFYISEINPRFGGGYPHAYHCGINIPGMIINNLNNIVNKPEVGNYDEGVYMMKYNEVKIIGKDHNSTLQ